MYTNNYLDACNSNKSSELPCCVTTVRWLTAEVYETVCSWNQNECLNCSAHFEHCYIPILLHAIKKDDTDRRMEHCEWFNGIVHNNEVFPEMIVWSDEAQFKLNGTVNRHNCVYCTTANPHVHVDKAVNLPGVKVWCGLFYWVWLDRSSLLAQLPVRCTDSSLRHPFYLPPESCMEKKGFT